ncbi:MAG: c-type cytochrome [Paracoccaceae bacterium]
MLKRIFLGSLGAVAIVALGFLIFAWRSAIAEVSPAMAGDFSPEAIEAGERVARAGYCATCHTAEGGAAYAGGYPVATGFGIIHSTNITPDPDTGIGRWSQAAFRRSMHEGVARDGSHLFPAFPYDHFTLASDADIDVLYAYLMTLPPQPEAAFDNTVPFPLNIRLLQAGWKLLFFDEGRYVPDPARTDEWNRGAYLAEGLTHCAACHTPRNALGARIAAQPYAGARVEDWVAPALTRANMAPADWDETALYTYLRDGANPTHGVALGTMGPVIHEGLMALPDTDIRALAVYFADVAGTSGVTDNSVAIASALEVSAIGLVQQHDADARLYNAACSSCHSNTSDMLQTARPELGLNSALWMDDPTNFLRVVLHGVTLAAGDPTLIMPGFAGRLPDEDIARLSNYLRETRTDRPPWTGLTARIEELHGERATGQ